MKTIEEIISEYLQGISFPETSDELKRIATNFYNAGIHYAEKWIDVNDELPTRIETVLVKIECYSKSKSRPEPFTIVSLGNYWGNCWKNSKKTGREWSIVHNLIESGFHASRWKVTHWRPIEHKKTKNESI